MSEPIDEPKTPEAPPESADERGRAAARSWAWPTAWMVSVLLVVAGGALVLRACYQMPATTVQRTGEAVERIGATLKSVAAALYQGRIHTSFTSYATTISPTHYLQFATLKQHEVFTRSDERVVAYIPMPEVVVEARAPIEYTYYFDLNGKWEFVVRDNVVHVQPPPIQFNQPSVDISRIEYEVKRGLVGSETVKADLQRSISFLAREKARVNIPLVRESGRKAVVDFVEKWLMDSFTDGADYAVKVHFPEDGPLEQLRIDGKD